MGILTLPQWVEANDTPVDTIPFSQFEQLVAQGKVTEVSVGQDTIQGKVKDKLPSGNTDFVTARVDPALAEKLAAKGIVVTGIGSGGFIMLLSWIVPTLVFCLVWIFLFRQSPTVEALAG